MASLRNPFRDPPFRAEYERAAAEALAHARAGPVVGPEDLAPLPPPVRAWLERAGVVGRPRPGALRMRCHGAIRSAPGAPWMPYVADQVSRLDAPVRLFLMEARLAGLRIQAWHRCAAGRATLRVRLAGLVDLVDARGPVMDRSETVTLLNDLCCLAPGALLGAPVRFTSVDERTVGLAYAPTGGQEVSARLTFDRHGDLAGFVSHDRAQSAGTKAERLLPWSTPIAAWREEDGRRIPSRGEARWAAPEGEFSYVTFELDALELDPSPAMAAPVTSVA